MLVRTSKTAAPMRVFLIAENRLLREALVRMLSREVDFCVVGASGLNSQTVQQVGKLRPDVLLADSGMSSMADLGLIPALREALPELRIVMIDMEEDREKFFHAVCDGVVGYLQQDASAREVMAAVRSVARGEAVCPPTLCMTLFRYIHTQSTQIPRLQLRRDLTLTRREQQHIQMISRGLTNKEIACELHLSEQTVKNHVHRILRKVGASDRMSLIEIYRLQGLISPEVGCGH